MSASIDWFGILNAVDTSLMQSSPESKMADSTPSDTSINRRISALGKYGQIPLASTGLVRDGPIESIEDASTPQS